MGRNSSRRTKQTIRHFYRKVTKSGSKYEPDTLTCFQRSIDRHCRKIYINPTVLLEILSLIHQETKLKAARKMLKKEGKAIDLRLLNLLKILILKKCGNQIL